MKKLNKWEKLAVSGMCLFFMGIISICGYFFYQDITGQTPRVTISAEELEAKFSAEEANSQQSYSQEETQAYLDEKMKEFRAEQAAAQKAKGNAQQKAEPNSSLEALKPQQEVTKNPDGGSTVTDVYPDKPEPPKEKPSDSSSSTPPATEGGNTGENNNTSSTTPTPPPSKPQNTQPQTGDRRKTADGQEEVYFTGFGWIVTEGVGSGKHSTASRAGTGEKIGY